MYYMRTVHICAECTYHSIIIVDKRQRGDNFRVNRIIADVWEPLLAEAFVAVRFDSSVFKVYFHASASAKGFKSYLKVFGFLL